MKFFMIATTLVLTSCMTGSFDKSTLPQTGASGKVNRAWLTGEPKPGLREISYKRHFTRSVQGRTDAVRVMLFVDPYLKLNAETQAADEGREKGYSEVQIQEEAQRIYQTNLKVWVENKTCFDFEFNSNNENAGTALNWNVQVKTIADGAVYPVEVKFSPDRLVGKGFNWFQFTGVMCTSTRLDPSMGLVMTLAPKHLEGKEITLTWE